MNREATAIITGIMGQDGAYLTQLLLSKGYRVVGLTRDLSHSDPYRLKYLNVYTQVKLEQCDLLKTEDIIKIFNKYKPIEIYHLSSQSSVFESFKNPFDTIQSNFISVINLLEVIKKVNENINFFYASSSEIFGNRNVLPITEESLFNPLSPYALSKVSAQWFCKNYRETYNLNIFSGILFNHESFLRGDNFFVKKVIKAAINISEKKQDILKVGNIDIERDFGYAPKYVEAMYLIVKTSKPDDFLICSGQLISLRTIIEYIFDKLCISKDRIVIDANLYRPAEIEKIYGSNKKIKTELKWSYSLSFYNVLDILLEEEIRNKK